MTAVEEPKVMLT